MISSKKLAFTFITKTPEVGYKVFRTCRVGQDLLQRQLHCIIIGALRYRSKHYEGKNDAPRLLTPPHCPSEAEPTSFYSLLTVDDFLLMMANGKESKGSRF
jgi:hypothetical protein